MVKLKSTTSSDVGMGHSHLKSEQKHGTLTEGKGSVLVVTKLDQFILYRK